jgi:WD40 repeat protein
MPGQRKSFSDQFALLVEELTEKLQAGEPIDVEAFLQAHPEDAEQLRRLLPALLLLAEVSGSGARPAPAVAAGDEPGELGDFRILREVGRGGMGIVYEAEQVSLGRRVALKVLPFAATMDPRYLQRFHNEARAAAGLHHTNIVPVYAVGCERGVHYYAMQFIDGRTLAEFITQQRGGASSQVPAGGEAAAAVATVPTVPAAGQATSAAPRDAAYFRLAAEWAIQAAEALDCAHALGVVHRDIKPANLLVDGTSRLWVTDFGLAQVQSDARLTLSGDLVGTLRYMSPEQAMAKRAVIDHRTDLYSLGATLYELLTLEPAFAGADRQELLRQIAFEEPAPPRRRNRAISAELETIVLKALEKNPADRYATARELADDLRRFLEHRPIRARRPTLANRAAKWAQRHRPLVAAAAAFLVLAVLGLTAGLLLLARQQAETARAYNLALERERTLRRTLYVQDVGLAEQAFEDGDLGQMRDLLDRHRPGPGQDDLRGFEWFYLERRYRCRPRPLASVRGHPGGAYSVAYAPDGATLASGGKDGAIRLWDADTLRLRAEWPSGQQEVNEVAFAPDGKRLASAGDDGTVRLWDVPSGRQQAELRPEGPADWMTALTFAPDGKTLVSGGNAGRVWLWDAATGAVRTRRDLGSGSVHYLAMAPDGRTVAVATDHGRALLLDAATLAERRAIEQTGAGSLPTVAFSRDGLTLATASLIGGRVLLWEPATGRFFGSLREHGGTVESLAFSPDGGLLALGAQDGQVAVWDVGPRTLRAVPVGQGEQVWCVTFSPDGRRLAAADGGGTVQVWDVTGPRDRHAAALRAGTRDRDQLIWAAFAPGGRTILTTVAGGAFLGWDRPTGRPVTVPGVPARSHVPPAMARDGRMAAVDGADDEVHVWDPAGGPGQTYRHPQGSIAALALSADGRRLAFADAGSPAAVWLWAVRPAAARELGRLSGACRALAFAPDGRSVAATDDSRVLLLDTEAGQPPAVLEGHRGQVNALAFSPDGRLLATASNDFTVRLWDVRAAPVSRQVWQHRGGVLAVAFSPDGQTLATGGSEVILWSVARGQPLLTPAWDGGLTYALAFSPDGRTLAGVARSLHHTVVVVWYGDELEPRQEGE